MLLTLGRGLWAGAALILAAAAAAASMAALLGRFDPRLDVLAHFAPLWTAGCVLALGAAALMRKGWAQGAAALTAGAGLAAGLTLTVPELSAAARAPSAELHAEPSARQSVRVVSHNVWVRNSERAETARRLAALNADVIVLQEADRDIPQRLKAAYPHQHACGRRRCEVWILSRRPFLASGGYAGRAEGAAKSYFAVGWARIDSPDGAYTVMGAHLSRPLPLGVQAAQRAKLAAVIETVRTGDLILAGDFNATPWSQALRDQDQLFALERRSRALATWPRVVEIGALMSEAADKASEKRTPAPFPVLPIDHIYAGEAWRTVSVQRGPATGSDHYPVVADLVRAGNSRRR